MELHHKKYTQSVSLATIYHVDIENDQNNTMWPVTQSHNIYKQCDFMDAVNCIRLLVYSQLYWLNNSLQKYGNNVKQKETFIKKS
jgi:hypothetical protein